MSHFPFSPRKWPFFYGYVIPICTSLGIIASAPGQTIGVSLFTDDLIESLSVSRLSLSTAYMVGTILSSLLITRLGVFVDRRGSRIVASVAAFGLGLVLLVMSQVDRIAERIGAWTGFGRTTWIALVTVTIGFMFMRFLGQGALSLASRTMLMRWFRRHRGKMNSLSGLSTALMLSATPWVFEQLIMGFGWRGAWILLGGILAVPMTLFIATFFRRDPESCGLLPDGDHHDDAETAANSQEEDHWTLAEAKATYSFWLFNGVLSLFAFYGTAVIFHIVSVFALAGRDRAEAVTIFIPAAVISITTQLVSGWLSDRYVTMKYYAMVSLIGVMISSAGVLLLDMPYGIVLIIVGNGMASGVFSTLASVTWPRFFGRQHLGAISGLNMSWLVFWSAVGPFLFGLSFSRAGSYHAAVVGSMAVAAVLMVGAVWAENPRRAL